MADLGSLVLYKDITPDQIKFLVDILCKDKGYEPLKVMESVQDNPSITLEMLDLLAGRRVKFPNRDRINKLIMYINMYDYVKKHNFDDVSYKFMAKQYGKRESHVREVVGRMVNYHKELYGDTE